MGEGGSGNLVTIAVAAIGGVQAIIVAVISNWDKLKRRPRRPTTGRRRPNILAEASEAQPAEARQPHPASRRRVVLYVAATYAILVLSQVIGEGRAFVYSDPRPDHEPFREYSDLDNFAWGLLTTRFVADCEDGIGAIEFSQRRQDRLAELLTLGFWKPVTVRYACRKRVVGALEGLE